MWSAISLRHTQSENEKKMMTRNNVLFYVLFNMCFVINSFVHVVCRYLEAHAEGEWEEDEDEKHGQPHHQVTTQPNDSFNLY
jgi:hypothetical protein